MIIVSKIKISARCATEEVHKSTNRVKCFNDGLKQTNGSVPANSSVGQEEGKDGATYVSQKIDKNLAPTTNESDKLPLCENSLEKHANNRSQSDAIKLRIIGKQDYHSALCTIPNILTLKKNVEYQISYNKRSFHLFKNLGIPFQIQTSNSSDHLANTENTSIGEIRPAVKPLIKSDRSGADIEKQAQRWKNHTSVQFVSGRFIINIPYVPEAVKWAKSLQKSYWSKQNMCWISKGSLSNLQNIQAAVKIFRQGEYKQIENLIGETESPKRLEIWQSPEHRDKIFVRAYGHGIDVETIKKIPERQYDKHYKRWIIPYDAAVIDRLVKQYVANGTKVNYRLPESGKVYAKKDKSYNAAFNVLLAKVDKEYKPTLEKYANTMVSQRYSQSTIKQYAGKFLRFLIHFKCTSPSEVTAEQTNTYLANLAKQNIADSTLNIHLSALKFYYEKVEFLPGFRLEKIKRPRNGRYLPTILSQNEVSTLLASCTNLKHSCILYTLYSSGIRLSELLSLKVVDIHWDRRQIFIRAGKGKKDRVVQLSEVLKRVLRLYFDEYKPIYWLFEGSDRKTQYSSSSVQKVVKKARLNAGIQRTVTPHVLRHCYATHLHDGGTSIKYIQELLGHKDIKTTLIYTHVSTHEVSKINSPLDMLEINAAKMRNE